MTQRVTCLVTPPHYQRRIDWAAELIKAVLGEETFLTAWAAGHTDPATVVSEASGRPGVAVLAIGARAENRGVELSPREREVLRLLVAGLSDKEIGEALGLSRRTAAYHVAAIRVKLDAPSRTAAAAIAVRDGLI